MKKLLALLLTICSFSHLMGADIGWSTPATISTTGVTASDPKVVIDVNGNATAVWVESNLVKASSQPAGMSWSAPTTLSGTGASSPKLGIDSSGNVTAIWVESGVVNSATLPFGGSWSSETAISGSGASSPALAVDASGNAVAVWVRGGFIESSTHLFGGSWGLVSQLTTNTSSSPQVAIGNNGTVVAVWHSTIAGANIVVSAVSPIAGSWSSAVNIIAATPAFSHDFPRIAVDANGNATAVWIRYNLSNSVYQNIGILAASLPVGSSSWAIPSLLTNGGETLTITNNTLRVAVDGGGNTIAVWNMSYDGSTYNVESSSKLLGGSWSSLFQLQGGELYAYQVDVAANNALGDALVVYMLFDGVSSVNIISQETNVSAPGTTNYSSPLTFSQGSDNGYPRVASSINGLTINAAAVWIDFNGTNNVIVASTGSKTTISPPTSLAVTQSSNNFGVFTEYYNTLSWTASTSPNLQQYNIYRDGVYFFSVDPTVTQVLDHNAIQSGSVTYGIAAEDSSSSCSPIATVSFP
jgi:hypothetical protein